MKHRFKSKQSHLFRQFTKNLEQKLYALFIVLRHLKYQVILINLM